VSEQHADPLALRRHVEALEGERHAARSPDRLASARAYVVRELTALGWKPTLQPFHFHGHDHVNVVAMRPGVDAKAPRTLVGAHLDTVAGTPGADDNASGVAGVLEVARLLADTAPGLPLELAVWDLEERTRMTYRVGSRRHVAESRSQGVRYAGALVLEMIGYRTAAPRSQTIPLPVRWMDLPRTGDFLAAIGDMGSRALLRAFLDAAARVAPSLHVEHLSVPFRGWAVWATRRSDNASFWSNGYPALMLTDTADLRNPHYHRATDKSETLDYSFMSYVVDAVTETARGPVT
jgi:Zn-dependent M28 family amino/carboxypeptidase